MTELFYGSVLPPFGLRAVVAFNNGLRNGPTHKFCDTNAEVIATTAAASARGVNVFHGCAVYATADSRKAENVLAVGALWSDHDVGPTKPYNKQSEAAQHYEGFLAEVGLPKSHVISSGNGIHQYHPFTSACSPGNWDRLAALYAACMDHYGIKHDSSRTQDKASILRPPGTCNFKTTPGKPVVIKRMGVAASFQEYYRILQAYADAMGLIAGAVKTKCRPTETNDLIGNRDFPPSKAENILPHCAVLREVAETGGDVGYEVWWRALGVAKHTTQPEVVAASWTRNRIATGHAQDDWQSTMAAWAVGPTTCEQFSKHSQHCATCLHVNNAAGFGPLHHGRDQVIPADPETQAAPASATDLALSKIFISQNSAAMKRDHSTRAWRQYTVGRWAPCAKGEHIEAVKRTVPFILNMAAKASKDDAESTTSKKLQMLALRAQSEKGISSALKLAESDPAVAVTSDQFDQDQDLLNVANGVVHLPTGTFRPHDPAQMLSKQSPVAYDPAAQCPVFLLFMEQVSCNDPDWIDYMQRQLGYVLSGRVQEEKMFFWFGDGRNGKSVLANVLRYIMGDYSAIAPVAMFMVSHRDGADATPQLAMLPGKRLMLANETEAGARLSAQMLKVAVSTEHISARALHGNPFSFAPTFKVVMRGNHLPIIQEGDEGTWRRIDLVPFDLKLTPAQCDPDLERKLQAEAPGILRWLIDGHMKWRANGLTPAVRVRNASLAYRKNSDVIQNWLDDDCVIAPGLEVEKAVAYVIYRQWAAGEGLRVMAKKSLTRALVEKGYTEGRQPTGARKEVYRGFKCK
jgi:putative DNA primase/helicase